MFFEILFDNRNLFEVYPIIHKEFYHAIKSIQRFETCNRMIESLIPLPAQVLFAKRFFPLSLKNTAEAYVNAILDNSPYQKKFIAGYPTRLIEDSFLDKLYQNLTLFGNETLFESYRELSKYQKFISRIDLDDDELEVLEVVLPNEKKKPDFSVLCTNEKTYLCNEL